MSKRAKVEELLERHNGVLTTRCAAAEGISRAYLGHLVSSGVLERVGHGVYVDHSYLNYDEEFFLQLQNPTCIFSYQTALYLHGLTERVPFYKEVTVPQGYNSAHLRDKAVVHQVKKEWHLVGACEVKTAMGNIVHAYDMERTICDLIRDRHNQDKEIFAKALQFFLKSPNKNMLRLDEYAHIFRIDRQLTDILEIIYA